MGVSVCVPMLHAPRTNRYNENINKQNNNENRHQIE